MKIQNNIIVPYHDPTNTMEEQSITNILLDFSIESPLLTFDEFVGSINSSTINNKVVVNNGDNDDVNIDGLEELPILDDFIIDILNDSGNGEENLLEDFVGNNEIQPIGNDFENPNHDQPPVCTDNPCSGCFVLREIVHTNGFRVMKLELHGEIGIISHVVLHVYDEGIAEQAQNHEFHMFDFSNESIFAVMNFLIQYFELRKLEGYRFIPDTLAQFYYALSVGINSDQENMYLLPRPVSMSSVNETLLGSEHNSMLSPINGTDSMPNNILANADLGESSMQGTEKGKYKKKTKFAAQRERTAEMKLKDFANLFDLPINAAAKAMKVCTTVVKKKCRDGGVGRWPYRKIKGMKTKIAKKKMALESARTPGDHLKLSKDLEKIEENLSSLYQDLWNRGISDSLANMKS